MSTICRRRRASGVEAGGQEARVAGRCCAHGAVGISGCGGEEQIGLGWRGRGDGATRRASLSTAGRGCEMRRGVAAVGLVEWSRRWRERSLVVGSVLCEGGALDGAVQEAGDDAAPEKDRQTEGAEDGTNANEDCAFGEGGVTHEWRVLCGRYRCRRIFRDLIIRLGGRGHARRLGKIPC